MTGLCPEAICPAAKFTVRPEGPFYWKLTERSLWRDLPFVTFVTGPYFKLKCTKLEQQSCEIERMFHFHSSLHFLRFNLWDRYLHLWRRPPMWPVCINLYFISQDKSWSQQLLNMLKGFNMLTGRSVNGHNCNLKAISIPFLFSDGRWNNMIP